MVGYEKNVFCCCFFFVLFCLFFFFWKQKQITQNFNNQLLIDVGFNLFDYKFRQEHKGKYEKRLLF